jgi:Uma2 family endonuclease
MATATQVSVEEYLRTSYEPECEYVNGTLLERNIGLLHHSRAHTAILFYLGSRQKELGVCVFPSLTLKISPTHYRIPDLIIFREEPEEQVPSTPPLVCVEVLSTEDDVRSMLKKIADYLEFGVPYVWLIDAPAKQAFIFTDREMRRVDTLRAEHIEVPLSEIFD